MELHGQFQLIVKLFSPTTLLFNLTLSECCFPTAAGTCFQRKKLYKLTARYVLSTKQLEEPDVSLRS